MRVNTDFYGEPDTWIKNTTIDNNALTPPLYWFKVADVNPNSETAFNRKSRLIDYVDASKLEFGQDVDPSICYAAMSGGPLVSVEMYNGIYDVQQNQSIKITGNIFDNPCGWFFATLTDVSPTLGQGFAGASYLTDDTNYGYYNTIGQYYWKIDNKAITYVRSNNVSAAIQPIVEFNPRGLYLAIMITIFNKTNGSYNNYTMDQVRTNFENNTFSPETHVIIRAYVEIYARRTATENYYAVDTSGANGLIAVPINHALIDEHDVINYGYRNNQFTITGWNAGNPNAYKFNHEGDTEALNDGNYYPFQRCFSVTPPATVDTAPSTMGYIWINTQETRIFQEAKSYNLGLGIVSYIEYSEANMEAIRRAAACFGLFFTEKAGSSLSTNPDKWTSNDMFCGVLRDGVGYGDYTRGEANRQNPIYGYTSSQDSPYKPDKPSDPNTYSLTTGFNVVGNVASTTKQYVINADGLRGLSGEMWAIFSDLITDPDDIKNLDNLSLDAFLTNNPIDAIVSVKKFPLVSVPHSESLENVYLGKYQTGAAAYTLATQQATYNFSAIPVYPKFGNCFLDYAPYTTMQLYIPFCGTVDIDPADFMGRNLSVELTMDFITGTVTAYILANELVVQSITGNCAIDVPITGTESATINAAIESATLAEKSARGNFIARGSIGGMLTDPIGNLSHPTNAITNRFNAQIQRLQANYDLQHITTPLRQIGAASPLNSWAIEFVCRLIIYYPDGEIITFNATNEPTLIDDKVAAFGSVNGFATVETNTLNNYEGFTQVSSVDLSNVKATEKELDMIRGLLQTGVYI